MPPLQRAITFTQMHRIAVAIAENLEFNMARVAEIFFEIHGRITERRFRFGPGLLHLGLKLFFAVHDLHAAAAAA